MVEIILSTVYIKRMFKDIQRVFEKNVTIEKMLILIVFVFLGYVIYSYSKSKDFVIDRMSNASSYDNSAPQPYGPTTINMPSFTMPNVIDNGMSTSDNKVTNNSSHSLQTVANPNDLLPKDMNSQWGDLNSLNSNNITTPDLLQAGYHIGLDTIGQTLRNANLQERSDPIIPKQDVGPWNASTIEPDYGRTPLEVGYGPR